MSQRPDGARPAGAGPRIALDTASELLRATFRDGVGWTAPLVIILLMLAGLLALLALVPAVAPFVYPLL